MTKGIVVCSLFDGCSGTQVALKNLGIPVYKYYASEIDKYAIQVTRKNFPNTIHLGDVKEIKGEDFIHDIDLLTAGSPCQGFSFAGKRLAFEDERSVLFFEFIRLLEELKPKYFLLENVKMKKEHQEVINNAIGKIYPECVSGSLFGIEPIEINSSLVSAQNRKRLYWTNIPLKQEQPDDLGIVLKDILETHPDPKHEISDQKKDRVLNNKRGKGRFYTAKDEKIGTVIAGYHKEPTDAPYLETYKTPKQVAVAADVNGHDSLKRIYSEVGKSPTVNAHGGGNTEPKVAVNLGNKIPISKLSVKKYVPNPDAEFVDPYNKKTITGDKSTTLRTNSSNGNMWVNDKEVSWRKLTPLECERLQTLPDNYTDGVSNTQRYKMIGNGFTIKVIEHFFENIM
tara:strand:+ start:4659 stop:5849 length:1191 start_codon:yes stop_codon:yes gene_type:complete